MCLNWRYFHWSKATITKFSTSKWTNRKIVLAQSCSSLAPQMVWSYMFTIEFIIVIFMLSFWSRQDSICFSTLSNMSNIRIHVDLAISQLIYEIDRVLLSKYRKQWKNKSSKFTNSWWVMTIAWMHPNRILLYYLVRYDNLLERKAWQSLLELRGKKWNGMSAWNRWTASRGP